MSGTQNNVIYFATGGGTAFGPPELWASNGTPGGTVRVQSVPSGSSVVPLAEYAGVFSYLSTGPGETDFYATEGSAQNTLDVEGGLPFGPVSITSPDGGSQFAELPPITAGNPPLIVSSAGGYLLETDSTTTNSAIIADLLTNGVPDTLSDLVAVGTTVFFVDTHASGSVTLDSTQGTVGVVSTLLSAGTLSALTATTDPTLGARLLFAATTAGDTKLEAIAPGSATPTVIADLGPATVGTIVAAGGGVFITETTATGAALLAGGTGNAAPTAIASFSGAAPAELTAAADGSARVFFVQNGGLWVANAAGASELAGSFTGIGSLYALGGTVYFAAATAATGNQLWSWNGSAAAATQLSSANAASGGINPTDLAALNGVLYFSASDGAAGTELWTSNGTAAGT
jgi:ELWxxDGT repeat protein